MIFKLCEVCSKRFYPDAIRTTGSKSWKRRKYCSIACCNSLKSVKKERIYCRFCGMKIFVRPSLISTKRYCSKICKNKQLAINSIFDKNHQWKGDNVGYGALHIWVVKNLGKPRRCEFCKTTTAKKFEWANKSQQYSRDITDWIRLCTSCHRKYDKQFITSSRPIILKNLRRRRV